MAKSRVYSILKILILRLNMAKKNRTHSSPMNVCLSVRNFLLSCEKTKMYVDIQKSIASANKPTKIFHMEIYRFKIFAVHHESV
jgi:hypothetical protein